jgi:stage IV sporulation protein FB
VLAEPERTPYDLNFRLFGFPVRIHPLFWLGAALLGANTLNQDNGLILLAIWVVVVFVSLMVHELGHAFAFRKFGSDAHVVLYLFFGLAVGTPDVRTRNQKIIVSLAGPLAGFLLAGVIYASHLATGWGSLENGFVVANLYYQLLTVNIVWGVFNLLPVFPLDGGQVSRELCERKWRGRGLRVSLQISFGVALAVAVYSLACELDARGGGELLKFIPWWARGSFFTAILFGMLAAQSYQLLQQLRGGGGYYYEGPDDRVPWEK